MALNEHVCLCILYASTSILDAIVYTMRIYVYKHNYRYIFIHTEREESKPKVIGSLGCGFGVLGTP